LGTVASKAGDVNSSGAFGAGIALVFFVLFFVIAIGSLVMLVLALVDIVRRPDWQWKLAGQEKILWLLLIVLVNFLAIPALIYWFNIRKKLLAVEQKAAAGQYGPGHMTLSGWEPGPPAPIPHPEMVPPGWHPDPSGQYQFRWWNGSRWTEHTGGDDSPAP
jgi:Protein of unknown function (DUF2510)